MSYQIPYQSDLPASLLRIVEPSIIMDVKARSWDIELTDLELKEIATRVTEIIRWIQAMPSIDNEGMAIQFGRLAIEEPFLQYLDQWRDHLETVRYSSNPSDTTNCQAFQNLVDLWKIEWNRATVVWLIEREYRASVEADKQYRRECGVDPERMYRDAMLPYPSWRVLSYLLSEIDPGFQHAINIGAPDKKSKDIQDAVLKHFMELNVRN